MLLTVPREHQSEALIWSRGREGFGFFSEQRTGKILQTLMVIEERKPSAVFITGPKVATDEWFRQLSVHFKLDWDCEFHIENIERVADDTRRWQWADWAEGKSDLLMVNDEAHRTKKRGSKWSKTVRLIGKRAKTRIALTGTPIAQGLQDIWALFDFMLPGLLENYEAFEERYLRTKILKRGKIEFTKIIGYRNEQELWDIYHQHMHRITLDEARAKAGKPALKVRRLKHKVELAHSVREFYDEFDEELEAEFNGVFVETPDSMTKIGKLQQICGGWVKNESGEWDEVGRHKFDALKKLIEEHPGEKAVICCRFKAEMYWIGDWLRAQGKTVVEVRGGRKYRNSFKGKLEEDYCIIQIQKGIAIDLSLAGVLIFYSWDYSYIDSEQIRFRIRSFDTDFVTEHWLICQNTVDEPLYEAVTKKAKFADLVNDVYRRRREHRATNRQS